MKVHYMSKSNEWSTPQDLFDYLDKIHGFTLDPCATESNAKCAKFYTKDDDGLSKSWANETVFMNPPYGREIKKWIEKAFYETEAKVVCLVPARTDTYYWHEYCMMASEIIFIRGRVKFGSGENSAPFPSCVVVFSGDRDNDCDLFTTLNQKEIGGESQLANDTDGQDGVWTCPDCGSKQTDPHYQRPCGQKATPS